MDNNFDFFYTILMEVKETIVELIIKKLRKLIIERRIIVKLTIVK